MVSDEIIIKINELAKSIQKDEEYLRSIEMHDAPTNSKVARFSIANKTSALIKLASELIPPEPTEWYEMWIKIQNLDTDEWEWDFHSKDLVPLDLMHRLGSSADFIETGDSEWHGIYNGYLYRIDKHSKKES